MANAYCHAKMDIGMMQVNVRSVIILNVNFVKGQQLLAHLVVVDFIYIHHNVY